MKRIDWHGISTAVPNVKRCVHERRFPSTISWDGLCRRLCRRSARLRVRRRTSRYHAGGVIGAWLAEAAVYWVVRRLANRLRRSGAGVRIVGSPFVCDSALAGPCADLAILIDAPLLEGLDAWLQPRPRQIVLLVGLIDDWEWQPCASELFKVSARSGSDGKVDRTRPYGNRQVARGAGCVVDCRERIRRGLVGGTFEFSAAGGTEAG
jgi:hypothetical protein